MDDQDGFEGFELLQPTDGRTTWLVVTRWRDEASFDAWRTGPAFSRGHGHSPGQGGHDQGQGDHGHGHGQGGNDHGHGGHGAAHEHGGHGAGHGAGQADDEQRPVAVSSELWSFQIVGGSRGQR